MTDIRPDPDHDALLACHETHHVVVASPGIGKTCAAVRLAGAYSSSMKAHERVLLLTFSNQARVQLEREASAQLDRAVAARVEITNYHRFFWRAVRSYCRALGLPLDVQIGSRQRRFTALEATGLAEVRTLQRKKDGLLDCLAEQAFEQFRDDSSPSDASLGLLLGAIEAEQSAGYLVFDDLGALFWHLVQTYPHVRAAYRARYPIVIADEHQDASALQDAVVRLLGTRALVVFADPMQMIYGFRGADFERLNRHMSECQCRHEFTTPHRWHGNREVASWLLAVRSRLMGQAAPAARPREVRVERTNADYGRNAVLAKVRNEASGLFQGDVASIAVLARRNDDVAALRNHLSKNGMYPRQVGSADDFEEARLDIEQLPLLTDGHSLSDHALDRLEVLAPTLAKALVGQVRGRLEESGVNLKRSSAKARPVLAALAPLYTQGAGAYFGCLVRALDACEAQGHHLPRKDAVRAIRETAGTLVGNDVEDAVQLYGKLAVAGAESARYTHRGLFVMTAHQSKGKEFDAIILAGLTREQFPDDDESRRLFYVALTRARTAWVFVAPDRGESPLLSAL